MAQMLPSFDRLQLSERVRQSCQWVIERAGFVTVDDDALSMLGDELSIAAPTPTGVAAPLPDHSLTRDEIDRATLTLALDAINFGSGYHDVIRKRAGRSGSQTMATSLEHYVAFTGPLDPDRLQRITIDDCSQIFGQELDGGAQEELMSLFATALVDLGEWIDSSGGVRQAISRASGSTQAFAESLTDMRFYRDVEDYRSVTVSFYKRAQITCADLSRRVRADLFTDLDQLTAFADNLVPHVLRMHGALHYNDELTEAIDSGMLLEPGSEAEIEIRAAGVECVERLVATTGHRAMDIDAALWTMGGRAEMKATRRHRARTVFY